MDDNVVYQMPEMTKIEMLNGAWPAEIYYASETALHYQYQSNTHKVVAEIDGIEIAYSIANEPIDIYSFVNDTILYAYETADESFRVSIEKVSTSANSTVLADGAYETYKTINEEIFAVAGNIFDSELNEIDVTLSVSSDEVVDIEFVRANGVIYYIIEGDLYSYDKSVLTKKLDAVKYYIQDEQIYFLSVGALYNSKLECVIKEGIISVSSAVTAGETLYIDNTEYYVNYGSGKYGNLEGTRVIEDIVSIYGRVNEFKTEYNGYFFVDTDGNFRSFDEIVYTAEYMQTIGDEVINVMRSDSGGYILITEKGICLANEYIKYNSEEEIIYYGGSGIAVINSNKITTYRLTIDSKLTKVGDYYYSDLSIVSSDTNGIVIKDSNNRQGFIDASGKLIIKPMYQSLTVTDYFVQAELINFNIIMLSHSGQDITGREYKSVQAIYDNYAILYDTDFNSCMVTANGIEYIDIFELGTITNYVTSTADGVVSNYSDLLSQEEDQSTNYLKFFIDGKIQLLKYFVS